MYRARRAGSHDRARPRSARRRETNLTVLLADEDEAALQVARRGARGPGHEVTPFAVSVEEAAELIVREDPDLTIVVVHQDDDHALALIAEAVETASGPVIAQLRGRDDVDFVARAAERGISAYVESNDPQDVQAAIEVTIRRYREAARLNEKVGQLESALERRAVIERAKGIVMERHGIDERDGVRAACATTRAPATGASSTSPRPSSTATRCCPRAPRKD